MTKAELTNKEEKGEGRHEGKTMRYAIQNFNT